MSVAAADFAPSSLFGAGDQGILLDTSVAGSLFQLEDGTTAATSAGDVVGYFKDSSGKGWHLTNSNTPTKGILRIDANGIKSVEVATNNTAQLKAAYSGATKTGAFTMYHVVKTAASASGSPFTTARTNNAFAADFNLDIVLNYATEAQATPRLDGGLLTSKSLGLAYSTPYIFKMINDGTNTRLDVVGGLTSTQLTGAAPQFLTNGGSILLGGNFGGTTGFRYAFAMLLSRAVTAEEEASMDAYVVSKFGGWLG